MAHCILKLIKVIQDSLIPNNVIQIMNFYYHRYAELHTEYSHTKTQLDVRTEELRKTRIDLQNIQERYMQCNCSWHWIAYLQGSNLLL